MFCSLFNNILESIKRARISSEEDPQKLSFVPSITSSEIGLRTLRPRQLNNNNNNNNNNASNTSLLSSLANGHTSSVNLHRQSSSSNVSSNHSITSMQLRSHQVYLKRTITKRKKKKQKRISFDLFL